MKKNLKVLYVALHFSDIMGGLELYNLDVAKSLEKLGCQVTAISTLTSEMCEIQGIPTRGIYPKNLFLRNLLRPWRKMVEIYLLTLPEQYDLVIAGHIFVLPQVAKFARIKKIPYWLLVFGTDAWAEWSKPIQSAISGCQKIISISHYTTESVSRRLDKNQPKIEMVYPKVDINLFTPKPSPIPKPVPCILTVGRLASFDQYKGHDLIISALPLIIKQLGQPVEYWIVGDGDDRPRLEEICRNFGLSHLVKFFGRVSLEQLIDIYNTCDVFAMPSQVEQRTDGVWTGEGFGIVYIEASACGKPVVAANQGGATDAVQDGVTGFLVNPNVEELAEAIYKLLADPPLSQKMGQAGRQFVINNFSQEVFDRRWAELMNSAVF